MVPSEGLSKALPLAQAAAGPALHPRRPAGWCQARGSPGWGGPLLPPCPRHSFREWSFAVSLQSNNLVIHSVVTHFHKVHSAEGDAPHIVTCTVEHDSVRLPLEHLVEEHVAGE